MGLPTIAEVFGHAVTNHTTEAREDRERRWCPFRGGPCTKVNAIDPIGVCSFSEGRKLATVCPFRFLESGRVFTDVGRLAFGTGIKVTAAPEVRVLRTTGSTRGGAGRGHRIGKVDYLVAKLDDDHKPTDFAALEVQAVYFSGASIKPAFREFLRTGVLPAGSERRLDWRSSAQKRLIPQLSLKLPVFRRWGKKLFVAVDSCFFEALPGISAVDSMANSEVTWLAYPFAKGSGRYVIGDPIVVHTTWDDVLTALREGVAPDPGEILAEIERKSRSGGLPVHIT